MFSSESNHNNFKHVSIEGEFLKSREFIGSDFFQTQCPNQSSTGLARYRSAPSSFYAALLDTDNINNSCDESEAIFSAFLKNNDDNDNQMEYGMKQETGVELATRPEQSNGFSHGQMGYEGAVTVGGGAVVGSYSVGMESTQVHVKGRNGNCSTLLRQSSSPAGFLNGYNVMGEVGNYKVQNHSEASSSANQINFSSKNQSSNLRFMPSIPESGNENIITRSSEENGRLRNCDSAANGREFEASVFAHDSWNESPFNNLKRNRDGDLKMFNGLENQNGETRKSSTGLVHHLSLPKTSSEMAAVEFLQFDTIPCQVRAKRGFATHPRSIAERVRRTKISARMKKLQDLFPNMDKQANTADMLDLAVEYIKDLQKQVQTLTDTRANCVCSGKA
ncbi:hypothetical protein ACJIZ3_016323 [Penstemon smallii]|uniref:BHLH domain-containing protein n=1 Tax=Penstemon smallii TaxID=265156 RepID=A0ABD3RUU8_9LAMI